MSWLGHESDADRTAVQQALKQTNLESFAERQIAKLSGGEQQRVLLARALAQATPVLLLDEPTNQLDLKHQMSLLMLVKKLAREKGLAVRLGFFECILTVGSGQHMEPGTLKERCQGCSDGRVIVSKQESGVVRHDKNYNVGMVDCIYMS